MLQPGKKYLKQSIYISSSLRVWLQFLLFCFATILNIGPSGNNSSTQHSPYSEKFNLCINCGCYNRNARMNCGILFTFFQYFSILTFLFPKSFSQMYKMINESCFFFCIQQACVLLAHLSLHNYGCAVHANI